MIHPKRKDGAGSSKDATPAESAKVNAPSGKSVKKMWRPMDVQLGPTEEHKQGQEFG